MPETPARPITFMISTQPWGGIGRCVMNMANELVQRGETVDLAITRKGAPPYAELLDPRVNVQWVRGKTELTAAWAWMRYARRRRPRVAIVPKFADGVTALSVNRWLRRPVPICLSIRNTLSQSMGGKKSRRVDPMRRLYPNADRIVTVSNGVGDDTAEFLGLDRESMQTIYNPLIDASLDARAAAAADHPWLGPPPREEPVILSAGRLSPQKNFPLLVEAFAKLRQRRPARLLILGEGSRRAEIEQRARELGVESSFDLPGMVTDPFPYMARADVFAMSSDHEGLGNVLAEAIACGAPSVSTDCPNGPREILDDGRLGRLVPPRDPAALADALEATLDHPPDRDTLRAGVDRFSIARVVDQYMDIVHQIERPA